MRGARARTIMAAALLAAAASLMSERPALLQAAAPEGPKRAWWKESVIYQVYPRSFKDSNGDGIGDLNGLTAELDYLKDLGVDILWLSPIFKSPNVDNGYDISDYRDIMTDFGTMADFDRFLRELKARKMRVILDLVANHSSDKHPWFLESRKSRDNPFRDYYFWRPPRNGKEPNNWRAYFSGPAWELDPGTGEYYLHLFAKQQPDLNWENPKLRREIHDVMRFWLDKGIDGFRMDVIPFISKNLSFPDSPPGFDGDLGRLYANGPRLHEYLKEMNREVISKYDILTVGEGAGVTAEDAPLLVDERRKELHMIYHFDHMGIDRVPGNSSVRRPDGFSLPAFKAIFTKWDKALGDTGWNSVLLGNHDFPRMVSRFGNDREFRVPASKMLGTLLLSMKGTPYVYQGDELGMTNSVFRSIDDFNDVQVRNAYAELVAKGGDVQAFLKNQNETSRDNARTPFQWDDSANAGFTSGKPWLGVNPNYREINARKQEPDADSPLHYFRQAIRVRKANPVLVYGSFEDLDPSHPDVFAYRRVLGAEKVLVVLNFRAEPKAYKLPVPLKLGRLLLGNYPAGRSPEGSLELRPYEAVVFELK